MKRKNIIVIGFVTLLFIGVISYRCYTNKVIGKYNKVLSYYMAMLKNVDYHYTGEVKLKRILKRTPKELVMLVEWEDYAAYISIENWLTSTHHRIVIRFFQEKWERVIME